MRIAITDTETTGLDPRKHELIEIGMVLMETRGYEIIGTLNMKIAPQYIQDADPKALQVNGYNPKDWKDAISLEDAMKTYVAYTQGAMFCAHNAIFDWGFLDAASYKTGIPLVFDRHKIDLLTLAWAKIPHSKVNSWSLKTICTYLGIPPEDSVHRALNGALKASEVYKKLMTP